MGKSGNAKELKVLPYILTLFSVTPEVHAWLHEVKMVLEYGGCKEADEDVTKTQNAKIHDLEYVRLKHI